MKKRAFKRIWGKPWDYAYLLQLEYHKIKEFRDYHQKRQFFEGWEQVVRDLNLCLKLIDIILERDRLRFDVSTGKMRTYVNTKNIHRFYNTSQVEHIKKSYVNTPVFQDSFRTKKALYLYNKIRTYSLFSWWD